MPKNQWAKLLIELVNLNIEFYMYIDKTSVQKWRHSLMYGQMSPPAAKKLKFHLEVKSNQIIEMEMMQLF